ncbi:MAG: DNA recombination protein RmuC [Dermatophilaceae bacterium]|nr:DNA recombination protein RmuC [Actinomycetales bacterium]MBP8882000.1 DNA recombination protein RmuC [Dermatophilaceae bacterium]MBP9919879.1 DNA recombination protein RmuC [Dermatophilaceae bacterium]
MDIFRDHAPGVLVGLVLGSVLGAILIWLWLRSRYAVSLATAVTERDLLRERVTAAADDLAQQTEHTTATTELVGSLRESLLRVEQQVHTIERERGDQFARVALELSRVQSSTEGLRDQTASLAGSLSSANVRGAWGEVALRRVLEHSGLLHRCDFDTQWSGTARTGSTVRPDVVVHLPGDKHVAVDAKCPMTEFLAAHADGLDASDRQRRLKGHATALRRHVEALSSKQYWTAVEPSPEFVVCFVPGEAFMAAALDADPTLHDYAMSRKVILASPATLLALLRTVAATWQHDSLAQGARELLSLGQELYARLGTVARHTDDVGKALRRSVDAYNALVGSIESRLLVTARSMHQMGVVHEEVATPMALEATTRPITAAELLAALDEVVARPQLPLEAEATGERRAS